MNKIQKLWANACEHAAVHREAYHHCLHASHGVYLGMVVFHGPYTLAACLCMVTLIIGYAFRLEIPDAKSPEAPINAPVFNRVPPRLG